MIAVTTQMYSIVRILSCCCCAHDGSSVVRVPTKINFADSNLTECILVGTVSGMQINYNGNLESVGYQHSMKIDERWECRILCAIEMKACAGEEKGRHVCVTTVCLEDR